LFTWGTGGNGQLGNFAVTDRSTPITTFSGGSNWKQVSSGGYFASAIKTDGTLWTWGFGSFGRLGNFATTNRSTPSTTFAGGTNWKQVSSGYRHTAAVKTDGTLWTWGYGYYGALGNNNVTDRSTPVTTFVGETNWKEVSVGEHHTAAIKTDGTLWIWGTGINGQLGNLDTTKRSTPITTFAGGTDWKQVSAGERHTAAIKTDGTLWIWGGNNVGQLGNFDANDTNTPITTFTGGTNWKQVDCGFRHISAIKTDGTLWGWGDGSSGRLGINDITNRSTPVTTFVGGTNWKQVSCGYPNTAAVKSDGTLWIWGRNSYGNLGTNNTITQSIPVTTFAGGTNWKQVSTGYGFTSAVTYIDSVL
jgi:alpha-tubulin suppressor-like RCC1 family protein